MSAIVSAADLASIEFQGLALPKPFGPFLGEIEPKTAVFVWGPPGSGKTTWVLDLAGLLAAHVDVLFVASEQAGPGRTLQDKAARLKLPPHVHFTDFEDLATLKRQVKRGYGAVVIDSAQSVEAMAGRSTMNALRAWCEAQNVMCIYMAHAYKDGSTYKGDSAWAHYAGIEVHIEEGIARTRKNRYADLGEMKVRFVVKKRTEIRRNPSCDPLSFDDAVSRTTVRAAQREVQARIRRLYEHHGTWKAVAEALNVSTSTLRNWRTGVPVSKSAMALISTQCELLPKKPATKKESAPKPKSKPKSKPKKPKPDTSASKKKATPKTEPKKSHDWPPAPKRGALYTRSEYPPSLHRNEAIKRYRRQSQDMADWVRKQGFPSLLQATGYDGLVPQLIREFNQRLRDAEGYASRDRYTSFDELPIHDKQFRTPDNVRAVFEEHIAPRLEEADKLLTYLKTNAWLYKENNVDRIVKAFQQSDLPSSHKAALRHILMRRLHFVLEGTDRQRRDTLARLETGKTSVAKLKQGMQSRAKEREQHDQERERKRLASISDIYTWMRGELEQARALDHPPTFTRLAKKAGYKVTKRYSWWEFVDASNDETYQMREHAKQTRSEAFAFYIAQAYREQRSYLKEHERERFAKKHPTLAEAFELGSQEAQEQAENAAGTSSGRVDRLPFGSIHVDPKRFQPRDAAFAEQSVQRIVDNFDARELDPLRVWRDTQTKLWYVLAGHSRHEALRRLIERGDLQADYPVPVDPYEGTVEEAIDFAHRENNKGTEQSAAENAVYLRRFIGEESKTALRERARTLFGRNGNTVLYLAHLAPNGSAMNVLRLFSNTTTSESRDVETMAAWLGQLRMSDDRHTDAHENEIWTWLKENYKTKGKKVTSYGAFSEWMKRVIEQRATFGELPERLNIAGVIPVSMQQQAIDRQVAEAEQALREAKRDLETKRRELVRKGAKQDDLDRVLKRYNDAVTIAQRELLRVRQEAGNAAAQLKQQEVSLFDTMRANPAGALIYLGTVVDIDGLAQGYELFHDAAGNRLLALPPLNVERIASIPADAGAIEEFEAWSGYEADGGMAVSLPGDDPISLGFAGSIRYTSDKLMEKGDAKGKPNAYQHHFDPAERRLYAWREAYIVDEVKVSNRGIMN